VTTAEVEVEEEEGEETTPRKENTLTIEVVIEEAAVTMTMATPEDPAPQEETPETMVILEEMMIAEEMTMVAILAR
tara:strand:- start:571 stop:798 length:228 start_codon:yes stop_codon:yes gene_type:complete